MIQSNEPLPEFARALLDPQIKVLREYDVLAREQDNSDSLMEIFRLCVENPTNLKREVLWDVMLSAQNTYRSFCAFATSTAIFQTLDKQLNERDRGALVVLTSMAASGYEDSRKQTVLMLELFSPSKEPTS